ncbi:hypothetical protein Tco_0611330 [Tanacetum coccineum]|uniref:Uncharacterized protein n=1 Tax=Tanacetum coccineum TaxID=301880 RepID=A0ABQ5FWR1_9ASTR
MTFGSKQILHFGILKKGHQKQCPKVNHQLQEILPPQLSPIATQAMIDQGVNASTYRRDATEMLTTSHTYDGFAHANASEDVEEDDDRQSNPGG